ncbi:MAG: lipopolysaccharide heptosyltransferase II [Planctomycetes bacterium]|nr:lipopolysaccharide heptosyltransferase II [Planctomycetota bacterium]
MPTPTTPLRLLIVLPSWVGDTVMATPTLRRVREALPGAFIGALGRPGIDQLLTGSADLDEIHTFVPHGMMAPKRAAAKVRARHYDTALLLTNSFSTALIARLAFIPRRIGYNRDNRAMLLTDPLTPPRNADRSWKLTPAVDYYWNLASHLLNQPTVDWSIHTPTNCVSVPLALPPDAHMHLPVADADNTAADELLARANLAPDQPFALLNPGGNNPAKRWPADRYAHLARHLIETHHLPILINGSPAESDLCESIVSQVAPNASEGMVFSLPDLNITLGALKSLCQRAALMVTNDTGPRHIAAAMGTPLVTLFGPTDPRWTTIPVRTHADGTPRETILVADPTLPPDQSANDHPDRCRVDRITLASVITAAEDQLARSP